MKKLLLLILILIPHFAFAQVGQFIPFLRSSFSTSTQATSTFLYVSGNITAPGGTVSASESVGGVINVNRSTNTGPGLVLYNNSTASGGRLLSVVCDAATYDTQCAHVRSDSTLETTFNVLGAPAGKGVIKVAANGAGDADGSLLSLDASVSSYLGQGIFLKCGTSAVCMQIRDSGNNQKWIIDASGNFTLNANSTTTNATTTSLFTTTGVATNLSATNLTFGSVTGNSWDDFCVAITGGAGLCDGTDSSGGGSADPEFISDLWGATVVNSTTTPIWFKGITPYSLMATSTFANFASSTQLSIGADGATAKIYFTEDGDGALTIQGIGNSQNESITVNLDDSADIALWSSATGITGFDYSQIRGRFDGLVIDGDGTFPASSDGSLIVGDGSDTGNIELEDGSMCIGDGGCTSPIGDGDLLIANNATATHATTTSFFTSVLTATNGFVTTLLTIANAVVTGLLDVGGGVLEIPNGTGPTADDPGEIAHDTTSNMLILDDLVIGAGIQKIFKVTVASTSPAFIAAGLLPIPVDFRGYTITDIACKVDTGTSKIIAIEDASGNASEDITCTTSVTEDDGSITNATYTALEESYIDFGATSGSVDYVTITAYGTITRE